MEHDDYLQAIAEEVLVLRFINVFQQPGN